MAFYGTGEVPPPLPDIRHSRVRLQGGMKILPFFIVYSF
jgi:hypothetical protein